MKALKHSPSRFCVNRPEPRTPAAAHRGLQSLSALYLMGFGLLISTALQAQTLTTLHSFNDSTEGNYPASPLVLSGSNLYGTTRWGGAGGHGTLFQINTNGAGFATVFNFSSADPLGNGDEPYGPLVVSDHTVYGTATGTPNGAVFKIKTDGSPQLTPHIFSGVLDGGQPFGGVVLSGNTLYGTTWDGVIFKVNTDGSNFKVLHSTGTIIYSGLAVNGEYLYGTTFSGGAHDFGTVFRVLTNGGDFVTLHEFQGDDGQNPWSELLVYGDRLYGTTTAGGVTNGVGVVFAMNFDGTGFTKLHSFVGLEGGYPLGGLIGTNGTLYGTAQGGGIGTAGIVFSLKTGGTDFTKLYVFSGGLDGGTPAASLMLLGNDLYGTTTAGGLYDKGTVFRLSLPGPAATSFARSSNNMVITWPTNRTGLVLQSSTDLTSWITVSDSPLMVNGQFTVTNDFSAPCRFFRLSR